MRAVFSDPRADLDRLRLRARKGLSQNFLRDEGMVHAILEALPPEPEALVEIGAGTGVMTRRLVETRPVAAGELDANLAALLRRQFRGRPGGGAVAGEA